MDAVLDPKATRRKSLFAKKGEEARACAQRELLLATLIAQDWHLTRSAEVLEMPGPSQILRAIDALGLRAEYEKARGWMKVAI